MAQDSWFLSSPIFARDRSRPERSPFLAGLVCVVGNDHLACAHRCDRLFLSQQIFSIHGYFLVSLLPPSYQFYFSTSRSIRRAPSLFSFSSGGSWHRQSFLLPPRILFTAKIFIPSVSTRLCDFLLYAHSALAERQ
jgi:hypothetical protein